MGKTIIAVRATIEQTTKLKDLAKRTGKTQTELLINGLDNSSELDRIKSENMTLKLEMQELIQKKGKPQEKTKYPKSARFPLTLQEHDVLRRAAFNQKTTMGLLLRTEQSTYLTEIERPALEAVN